MDYELGIVEEVELVELRPRVMFAEVRRLFNAYLEARRATAPRRRAIRREWFRQFFGTCVPGTPGFGRRLVIFTLAWIIFMVGVFVGIAIAHGYV